jgi:hypothetical protein
LHPHPSCTVPKEPPLDAPPLDDPPLDDPLLDDPPLDDPLLDELLAPPSPSSGGAVALPPQADTAAAIAITKDM